MYYCHNDLLLRFLVQAQRKKCSCAMWRTTTWKTFSNSCWPFTVENCQSSETKNKDFFSGCWGVIQPFMCVLIQILPGPVFFFQLYSTDNYSAKVKWLPSTFSWRKHTNKQTNNKLTLSLSLVFSNIILVLWDCPRQPQHPSTRYLF